MWRELFNGEGDDWNIKVDCFCLNEQDSTPLISSCQSRAVVSYSTMKQSRKALRLLIWSSALPTTSKYKSPAQQVKLVSISKLWPTSYNIDPNQFRSMEEVLIALAPEISVSPQFIKFNKSAQLVRVHLELLTSSHALRPSNRQNQPYVAQ